MEPLQRQLRELPKTLAGLPAGIKFVTLVAALAAVGVGAYNAVQGAEAYQYAFTNLTPEDSAEAVATLKTAGVAYRLEAGGSALAVPAAKVYDARLLLAGAGLPRGGGVGFEIFDRGDLGVSEFTQKVNLRRATEGELARTISRLTQVRGARVHLTMPEKGLFRDQDRAPSAAVVVNLQPGRTLGEKEIAGIRHLVSAAVPGLAASGVTVVDGKGEVLSAEGGWGEALGYQKRLEHDLERRVVGLLEQAVGSGAVVARVTAVVDSSEVQTSAETVDPDATALRSERRVAQSSQGGTPGVAGVAGAAANQPLAQATPAPTAGRSSASSLEDQTRNFDVSRTTTTTTARVPRLQRISVAVLVDGLNGQPRPQAELDKLGELARKAVGFDQGRGDDFDITSAPFSRSEAQLEVTAPPVAQRPWLVWAVGAGGLALAGLAGLLLRRKGNAGRAADLQLLTPGASVAQLEAALAREAATSLSASSSASDPAARPSLADPASALRERARELATRDPTRAAHILRAWMAQEQRSTRSPHA